MKDLQHWDTLSRGAINELLQIFDKRRDIRFAPTSLMTE
jgi:hypothetical protein